MIDGANRNDHKLMRQTIEAIPIKRPKPTRRRPQHLCLDKGFDYEVEKESPFGKRLNDGRRPVQADADVELSRFGG